MKSRKRETRFVLSTLFAFLALALVACGGTATEPTPTSGAASQESLTVSGSGTTTLILLAVEPAFKADVPEYDLDILPGSGTGGGVKGVLEGILDVAAMARPPKEDEAAQDIEYVEFGQSGVALYTHSDLGITDLTTAQLKAIYSGEVTNWSQVGGPDQGIILYVRDEGDSSTKALRQTVFGDESFAETAQVLTSQPDMQAAVANTPSSVGFGSWPAALAAGADVQAIALDGVAPDDPTNPMVSPIGLGYLAADEAAVQPLIDWLLSERGQSALHKVGVITSQ